MDEQGLNPSRTRRCALALRQAGRRSSSSTRSRTPQPRWRDPAAGSTGGNTADRASGRTCLWWRTTRTGCSASTVSRSRRCDRLTRHHVIYLGSFSKTFAPGFRVGWVLAPHAVREKLVLAQEAATLCPPVFSQFAVACVPGQPRLARTDQGLPRDVSRTARCDDHRVDQSYARRHHVDLS